MDSLPEAYQYEAFLSQDLDGASEPYKLLNSIIVPRPIAFITTKSENGIINAAPFSYFNAVCTEPVLISVAISRRNGQRKDTSRNIFATKEFVINICSVDLAKVISFAAQDFPPDISEIDLSKLSLLASKKISVPRIANTPIQMECVFKQTIEFGENRGDLIIGEVVNIHLHKKILDSKGHIDFEKLNPLARLSGKTYAELTNFFDIH